MSLTITLPDKLGKAVYARAQARHVPPDDLVIDLLARALDEGEYPTIDQVVAAIKSTPPDSSIFHPAQLPLAEALAQAPEEPPIDEAAWNQEWARVEADINTLARANDLAEGRG